MKAAPLPGFAALPLEEAAAPLARSRLRTEDFSPPPGVRSFSVRLYYGSGRKREVQLDRLTKAELAWVSRTLLAVMGVVSSADEDLSAVQEREIS